MNVVGAAIEALTVTKAKLKVVKPGPQGSDTGGFGDALASAGKAMAGAALGALGIGVDSDPDDELTFSFNPTKYTVTRAATWGVPQTSGQTKPGPVSYQGQVPQKLDLEIFFDAFEVMNGDVSKKVTKLLNWCRPEKAGETPPRLAFIWGPNPVIAPSAFYGYLESVTANYLMFSVDGTPVRATATIKLVENFHSPAGPNPTSHGIAARKSYQLKEGDSLHSVAFREYGQPSYWRSIAAFNDIDDPLRVEPGRSIFLPSAAEAARLA